MITIKEHIPPDEILDQVRDTTLWQSEVRPYEQAEVDIREVELALFRPLQRYALRGNVAFQAALRADLLEQGYDSLQLDGGVLLDNDGFQAKLVPPIIERDDEYGDCLVDGTHRVYMARQLGQRVVRAICISGVSSEYPLLAFPSEWSDMVEYDTTPSDGSLKRLYRPDGDPILRRRDFGPLNGSVKRKAGSAV